MCYQHNRGKYSSATYTFKYSTLLNENPQLFIPVSNIGIQVYTYQCNKMPFYDLAFSYIVVTFHDLPLSYSYKIDLPLSYIVVTFSHFGHSHCGMLSLSSVHVEYCFPLQSTVEQLD